MAESLTVPPILTVFADRVVAIIGLALTIVSGSQAEVAGLLVGSPLYAAVKLRLPVEFKSTALLLGTTPFVTVTTDTTIPGAVHAPLAKSV
jgi:hypothetical protein